MLKVLEPLSQDPRCYLVDVVDLEVLPAYEVEDTTSRALITEGDTTHRTFVETGELEGWLGLELDDHDSLTGRAHLPLSNRSTLR